jgi:hypothetical protein
VTLPIPDAHSGLFSRLLTADRCVDDAAWIHHRDTLGHVGKCRRCRQPMRAGHTYEVGSVTWYVAECTSPVCDYEVAAHGPRPTK